MSAEDRAGKLPSLVPSDDGVYRSACTMCLNFCGILAHNVGGKVVKVEGDPDNPRNRGHLCAKGLAAHVDLNAPNRIKRPLLRTNPEKGLGIDPKWKEIQWDEAISIVAEKLRKSLDASRSQSSKNSEELFNVRLAGSNRILLTTFDHWATVQGATFCWAKAADAFIHALSAPVYCGNAVHPPSYLNTATFEIFPDGEYARYFLLIGSQAGSAINYDVMNMARNIAEKRPSEVKVVVVDPMCGYAASRAEEWVPIRPGTDAAFILALVNLLINEYGIYDRVFIKNKTNAPYLVGDDGQYLRDSKTQKPLVYDASNQRAVPFDQPVDDYALEGEFLVGDKRCKPGFQLLKEHVRKYTPEFASAITTIAAETIKRIAREMGEAATIGSTIEIDGVTIPHRPVSVAWYRGLSAHRHSFLAGFAALLLPTLLGAIQVPGGITGHPVQEEYVTEDGLMAAKTWLGAPYPPRQVKAPSRVDVFELFPVAVYSATLILPALLDPERWGLTPERYVKPEILFTFRNNPVKSTFAPEMAFEALKQIPFIVAFNIKPDETMSVADIVFPELHHFEKLSENLSLRVGEPGYWYGARPVVKPPYDAPYDRLVNNAQVLLEIADKAGFLSDVYRKMNEVWKLVGTEYELDPIAKYGYDDLIDRRLRSWLGQEHGLNWMLGPHGGLLKWATKPQERWRGAFRDGRIHLYYEFMIQAGRQVADEIERIKIPWDTGDYQPLPDFKPCPSYLKRNEEYDLYVINYKVPVQSHSFGKTNPLLRNLVEYHGLDISLMNPETALRKGIHEGDRVMIETIDGKKGSSVIGLSERIHPEVLATMQTRLSKGLDYNSLVSFNDDSFDFVGTAIDSCLLAKVIKE